MNILIARVFVGVEHRFDQDARLTYLPTSLYEDGIKKGRGPEKINPASVRKDATLSLERAAVLQGENHDAV